MINIEEIKKQGVIRALEVNIKDNIFHMRNIAEQGTESGYQSMSGAIRKLKEIVADIEAMNNELTILKTK